MARPSQCIVCGCFEVCLFPSEFNCAENEVWQNERKEWKAAVESMTEMERAHYDTDMH